MAVVKRDSLKKGSEDQTMVDPPDGGWGWVVVFASFMIHVIADGVTYTFGIFYVEFLDYYKESKGTTAWVASIMVGTTYCIGPVASGLTNKYGCRAVTVAGAILAAFGLAISTLSPNVLFLFFSIGLCTGAGFGLMYLPSIVSVTCYFERKRAFATGIAVCGSGMGTFALAPLTEHLVASFGWKGAMLVIAGLVLSCAVFGGLFRPLRPKPGPPKPTNASSPLSNAEDEASSPLMSREGVKIVVQESSPKHSLVASDSKLANGFLEDSKPAIGFLGDSKLANGFLEDSKLANEFLEDSKLANGFLVDSKLANGFQGDSKPAIGFQGDSRPDIPANVLPAGYCTSPSTPSVAKANGFAKDAGPRANGSDHPYRNSLLLPHEYLRRKVEGSPLSSFVCSSASLAQTHQELSRLESAHRHQSHHHHNGGLLYRKDIFYSGSLNNLAKHRSIPNISYSSFLADSDLDQDDRAKKRSSRFLCCPAEIRDALAEMTDFSILLDPVFLLFAVSNFLTSIGFNVPYVYTKDRVADMDIATAEDASYLLSIIGISNTVGRVTLGYLSDRSCVNRLWIYNVSLVICGLATALSCYASNYVLMGTYCATFGATAGAYVSLTSVILVDLLGLDKLTNAFGILLVFEGVSCLLGPPITGWLYDGFGSYDPGFLVSGAMIAVSGLILFFVPCLSRKTASVCQSDACEDGAKPLRVAETSA